MGFASAWLQSWSLFPELIEEAPHPNTGIIIVVPSFDEPGITDLLGSLTACIAPSCNVEIIIIVNAPENADEESIRSNKLTLKNIEEWGRNRKLFFRLYTLNLEKPSIRGWGVGLARKTGMDEALRRFDHLSVTEGIIACLDGDCMVSSNYLTALEKELLNRKDRKACSVSFEHPLSGDKYTPEVYNSVTQYELHLRYYYQALKYAGFPNVFHTVGSTIAVKAKTYMKAGGMNRRQAGEDFYFIQKLVPAGGYFSLSNATVFPSPRVSRRVPFGTGYAVGRMVENGDRIFLTYNPEAFEDLRIFFGLCLQTFKLNVRNLEVFYNRFPSSVKSFISLKDWKSKIIEISDNTSEDGSFKKRFFEWFNMFRIVKYLNQSHREQFIKIPAGEAAKKILKLLGYSIPDLNDTDLLKRLRETERSG